MTIRVTIKNEEPEGASGTLVVTVVTVGNADAEEQRHRLAAQQAVTVPVYAGQFVMVDDKSEDDPT